MSSIKLIGILGGTFDPVHLGHVHLARSILEQTYLSHIKFVPCSRSPLRSEPFANNKQRLKMLDFITKESFDFSADRYEIDRPAPSYTVDTLRYLHNEVSSLAERYGLCLIVGADAFMNFTSWHKWREILKLCNIIVADRPGVDQSYRVLPADFPATVVDSPIKLHRKISGLIWFADIQPLNISSSAIRYFIRQEKYISAKSFLHPSVWNYIEKNNLYRCPCDYK